jgi:hypothetical protein
MFLQNLYNWKPFRAVTALMLVLFTAIACQETAQQVIHKSANAPLAQTESSQQNLSVAQITSLSEAEKVLAKKIEGDKDIAAMNEMQKTLVFKMKIAVGHDKEKFKQAIINKDYKTYFALMNFSETEYKEFSAKLQLHLSNFKTRYAADMATIENFRKRNPTVCNTCQVASPESESAVLEKQLEKIENANVEGMDKIQAFDEVACRRDNPEGYANYKLVEGLIYAALVACQATAIATFQYYLIPICFTGWAAGLIAAQCDNCGC